MTILIPKEYFYGDCKRENTTDYYRNNFTNVADVYAYLKEGIKDILQEFMETERDAVLGYEKTRKVT